MTNWESERINFLQQQAENDRNEKDAQLLSKQTKEREVIIKLEERYRSEILPGFELLDKLGIPTTLQEIRDQVWKIGEIEKSPKDFEEFKKNTHLKPQYKLHTHTISYIPPQSYCDDKGNPDSTDEKAFDTRPYLIISTDCLSIFIARDYAEKSILIPLAENEEDKDKLHQILLEDCSKRRDYSKIEPILLSKPGLLTKLVETADRDCSPHIPDPHIPKGFEYLKTEYGAKPKTRRSLLDIFLGK